MDYLPWILPSASASLLYLVMARVIWQRRKLPVVRAFLWLLVCMFIWAISRFTITLLDDNGLRLLVSKIQYIGIAFTPLAWLVISLTATRHTRFLTRPYLLLLALVPLTTVLMAFSNDYHHLLWKQLDFSRFQIHSQHGPWFSVHIAYSYLLIGIATVSAAIEYLRQPRYRWELIAIVLAPLTVLFANFNNLIGWVDVGNLDIVSLAFVVSVFLFFAVVLKDNYLQLAPLARALLVENMQDAIVVLNDECRVIDTNPAAERLFGKNDETIIGEHFRDIMQDPQLSQGIADNDYSDLSLQGRDFQALNTRISITPGRVSGHLVVFRDISELKAVQKRLEETTRELQAANADLQILANTDALTQLPNRRSFFERFAREVDRSERTGSELCMLILDLDHFKQINDTHGHAGGDAVLQRVAKTLQETARTYDITGRLGGEEFGLLFPDTDIDSATHIADRLRLAIQHSHRENDIPVTASLGLARAESGMGLERIYDKADAALYAAKAAGRNRVSVG